MATTDAPESGTLGGRENFALYRMFRQILNVTRENSFLPAEKYYGEKRADR